ncbi:AsmA family protein [Xanthovirga aplysinae]|uniref:AsmA family protein n=1 Tax=Xanthovirga aplysinae TaxID=2529853 RepID=UPI0012BC00EB|nr:AsmA-like C-terminal region-containing protein [Xanthovirga aplysinae]MTI30614.1 AsmA family protein [Xanthovirga aplysinae]
MKKALLILGVLFVLLMLMITIIPFLIKGEVKKGIDEALEKNVNAAVFYDTNQFGLNLFRNFPNATLTLGDFGMVNRPPFEGDTLISVKSLIFEVNIVSVLKGDTIKIEAIGLDQPKIQLMILEENLANYDIFLKRERREDKKAPSEVSFQINHWEIKNGDIIYNDRSMNLFATLEGLNHSGKGDFSRQVFDIVTHTDIDNLTLKYRNTKMASNKRFDANIIVNLDLDKKRYKFKDNRVKINDFAFRFGGFFAKEENDMSMDIFFQAEKTSFKDLLSLVPIAYKEEFENIKAEGMVDFGGFVRGIYSSDKEQKPSFQLKMFVDKGQFQFNELPKPIRNVKFDLLVDNKDGKFENTIFIVKQFHAELGNSPLHGSLLVEGIKKMKIDGQFDTEIDLAELTTMFPLTNMTLKGKYKLHAKANGVYDAEKSMIPRIDAVMNLENGYLKTKDFPVPLENIFLDATAKNTSGKLDGTTLNINDLEFELEGEQLVGNLTVKNFNDYTWNMNLKGDVDLAKITKIYPLDSVTLSGRLHMDINTKGKMSDLEAKNFDRLPTRGILEVQEFSFKSFKQPQEIKISEVKAVFDPQKITINNMNGYLGKSDFQVKGSLSNYLAYVLKGNEILQGNLDFNSNSFDLNEWMKEEPSLSIPIPHEEEPHLKALEVPKNIDFVVNSKIEKLLYSNLHMSNMKGLVVVKDGVIRLENGKYQLIDGNFGLEGMYDSRNLQRPKFDFDFDILKMKIADAYNSFDVVKKFAPIAGRMNGDFTTDFVLSGELKQDMKPEYNSLNGKGLVSIRNATLKGSNLLGRVLKVSQITDVDEVNLNVKDVDIQAEIKDGRLFVQPFELNMGSYVAKIEGSQGVDGTMDFSMEIKVPAHKLGAQVRGFISGYLGGGRPTNVIMKYGIKGTRDNPLVKVVKTEFEELPKKEEPADTSSVEKKSKKELEKKVEKDLEKLKRKEYD